MFNPKVARRGVTYCSEKKKYITHRKPSLHIQHTYMHVDYNSIENYRDRIASILIIPRGSSYDVQK